MEPRWPVVLTILVVLLLMEALPARIRLFSNWFPFAIGIAMLVPIAAVGLTAAKAQWLRIERINTLFFSVAVECTTLVMMGNLVFMMVRQPGYLNGVQLLSSSIAVWVTNVLTFSLMYWQIDHGGPEARMNNAGTKPDWLFPQTGVPEQVSPNWQPSFVDYLFLGFTTATAFSTTDVIPLTGRAKLLMMIESMVSLVTIAVIASRAINILGK